MDGGTTVCVPCISYCEGVEACYIHAAVFKLSGNGYNELRDVFMIEGARLAVVIMGSIFVTLFVSDRLVRKEER